VPYRRKKLTFAISSPDEFLLPLESTLSPGLYAPHKQPTQKEPRYATIIIIRLHCSTM